MEVSGLTQVWVLGGEQRGAFTRVLGDLHGNNATSAGTGSMEVMHRTL